MFEVYDSSERKTIIKTHTEVQRFLKWYNESFGAHVAIESLESNPVLDGIGSMGDAERETETY